MTATNETKMNESNMNDANTSETTTQLIEDTPYTMMGGATRVQDLVTQFYDLMDIEPKFKALRATHHGSLAMTREKLFMFLSGWLGGPQLYLEQHGHPRLRARHMPFKIGVNERDQWVACMAQAMRDIGVEETLFQKLIVSFYGTADWMRNQPDPVEGDPRLPNQVGIEITGVPNSTTKKLQSIAQQYGVRI